MLHFVMYIMYICQAAVDRSLLCLVVLVCFDRWLVIACFLQKEFGFTVSWSPGFEPWRFGTTFSSLGGDFLSFSTLIDVAVIVETVAQYETVLQYTRPWVRFSLLFFCDFQ